MPVNVMQDVEIEDLQEPKVPGFPTIPGISGASGSTKHLTARTYKIIENRDTKVKKHLKQMVNAGDKLKLGYVRDRAVIPRALGEKLADMSESYSRQLKTLKKAWEKIDSTRVGTYGTEIEGGFAKSKSTAARFQRAVVAIEKIYNELREMSLKVLNDAWTAYCATNASVVADDKFIDVVKKYEGEVEWDSTLTKWKYITRPLILLPLLKGRSVYTQSSAALNVITSVGTKSDNSVYPQNRWKTRAGTVIEMLYQVQPVHKLDVFSDHAGFVCKYDFRGMPALFIYYQSLEHGHTFTNQRAAKTPGARGVVWMPVQGNEPKIVVRTDLHEPRNSYIGNLRALIPHISALAKGAGGGDILIIIGECTKSVDDQVMSFLKNLPVKGSTVKSTGRTLKMETLLGALEGYTLTRTNASKKQKNKKNKWVQGLGVHALVGYLLHNPANKCVTVSPKLVTFADGPVTQNFLSVDGKIGGSGDMHAFAHLLNKQEDKIARELKACDYSSVGGDLNKLTIGDKIIETIDRNESYACMWSNAAGDNMYDKICIIEDIRAVSAKRDHNTLISGKSPQGKQPVNKKPKLPVVLGKPTVV